MSEGLGRNWKNIFVLLYMGGMPLICSSVITGYAFEHQAWFESLSFAHWALLSLLTIFTMGLAMTPTTFLAIFMGYFLGIKALLVLVPAYIAASVLGFTVGKKVDGGTFLKTFDRSNKSHAIIEGLKKNEFLLIVLSRMSPVLPFAVMNVVLSVGGARLKRFVVAGAIGMLPRTILSVLLGAESKDLVSAFSSGNGISTTQIVILILFVLSTVGMGIVGKRVMKRSVV